MATPGHSEHSSGRFWAVVRESVVRRLGKPLLWVYAVLFISGVVVVAGCVVVMWLGGG